MFFFSFSDISMAHCQQAGWKWNARDPSVQLQQGLLQQVWCCLLIQAPQTALQSKLSMFAFMMHVANLMKETLKFP